MNLYLAAAAGLVPVCAALTVLLVFRRGGRRIYLLLLAFVLIGCALTGMYLTDEPDVTFTRDELIGLARGYLNGDISEEELPDGFITRDAAYFNARLAECTDETAARTLTASRDNTAAAEFILRLNSILQRCDNGQYSEAVSLLDRLKKLCAYPDAGVEQDYAGNRVSADIGDCVLYAAEISDAADGNSKLYSGSATLNGWLRFTDSVTIDGEKLRTDGIIYVLYTGGALEGGAFELMPQESFEIGKPFTADVRVGNAVFEGVSATISGDKLSVKVTGEPFDEYKAVVAEAVEKLVRYGNIDFSFDGGELPSEKLFALYEWDDPPFIDLVENTLDGASYTIALSTEPNCPVYFGTEEFISDENGYIEYHGMAKIGANPIKITVFDACSNRTARLVTVFRAPPETGLYCFAATYSEYVTALSVCLLSVAAALCVTGKRGDVGTGERGNASL